MKNSIEVKNKLIAIIREYLVTTNSKKRLQIESYSIQDLKKVCYLYGIKLTNDVFDV